MVLVNGAEGIGTGWSTSVPTYNPRDVIDNVRAMLAGREPAPMDPWFRGFRGTVTREEKKKKGKGGTGDSFTITGCIRQVDDATVEITELPVRKWTQDYKEFLEGLVKPEGKDDRPAILDYKEHHTDTSVHFTVTLSPEQMAEALATGLHKKFKLSTTISTTNMTLFDRKGRTKRYDSPEEILQDFYTVRRGAGGTQGRGAVTRSTSDKSATRGDADLASPWPQARLLRAAAHEPAGVGRGGDAAAGQ